MFNTFLVIPLTNLLMLFYKVLFGNLGLAILGLTLFMRVLLLPLSLPSLKTIKKQQVMSGELAALKKKYGEDRKKLAEEQLALYRRYGINPAAGCLPQILQIIILIALYQAFYKFMAGAGASLDSLLYSPWLRLGTNVSLNTDFLYLNMEKPDPFFILPLLAGLSQFLLSKMMLPATTKAEKVAKETPGKSDDLMYTMQQQSLYLMPLMTVFISWKLPSGIVLYWLATTLFSFWQQRLALGSWGGLGPIFGRLKIWSR